MLAAVSALRPSMPIAERGLPAPSASDKQMVLPANDVQAAASRPQPFSLGIDHGTSHLPDLAKSAVDLDLEGLAAGECGLEEAQRDALADRRAMRP